MTAKRKTIEQNLNDLLRSNVHLGNGFVPLPDIKKLKNMRQRW